MNNTTAFLEELKPGIDNAQRFSELATRWKAETAHLSNTTERVLHPAYQRIIGMGGPVVSLILKNLHEHGPDDWFWALTAITGENPLKNEFAGNMAVMTEAWLQWGTKANRSG